MELKVKGVESEKFMGKSVDLILNGIFCKLIEIFRKHKLTFH